MRIVAALLLLVACTTEEPKEAPKASEAERLARGGVNRLSGGDLPGAQAAFVNAKAAARNEPWGRIGLASLALSRGDVAGAREMIESLRADGLDPSEVAPFLVAVIDARKDPPDAPSAEPAVAAREAPTRAPAAAKAPSARADEELAELFRAGHYNGLIERVSRDKDPSLFRLKLLADSYYNLQQWQASVTAYRRVLAKEPTNEAVTQYLADALFRLERYDDSIRMYRLLAETNPDKPGFWKQIGDVASAKKDNEVALAAYNKAIAGGYDKPEVRSAVERLRRKLNR